MSLAWILAGIGSCLVGWRLGYGADERQQRG
jgi:hypothetical protein